MNSLVLIAGSTFATGVPVGSATGALVGSAAGVLVGSAVWLASNVMDVTRI